MYPEYRAYGKLPKTEVVKINQRVRDLFTSKIGSVIVDSVDTIVIYCRKYNTIQSPILNHNNIHT